MAENILINCIICNFSDENFLLLGPKISLMGMSVHLNCMMFSSFLKKTLPVDEGACGFKIPDIIDEAKRVMSYVSTYFI